MSKYHPVNGGADICTTWWVHPWLAVDLAHTGKIVGFRVSEGHTEAEAYVAIVNNAKLALELVVNNKGEQQ